MASIYIQGVSGPPCKAGCPLHVHAEDLPSNRHSYGNEETNDHPVNWTAQGNYAPQLYVCTLCEAILTAEETETHVCKDS